MSAGGLWRLPAHRLAGRVRGGGCTALEAVTAGWEGPAAEWERDVHAIVHSDPEARAAGAAAAPAGPLAGVPVVVKDNLCTRDLPTTCGSRILAGYQSPYDATVIERLRAAGGVVTAKGNMDEFAMGSSTEHSCYGPTRNPYDLGRVPGGSSGGPAAAVAYGLAPLGLGSDTGGSVRQPAAFCGVLGLKPTYGRLSRHGLVAFASSLDQVGLFARCVADVALLYAALAGPDARDATSRPGPAPDVSGWDGGVAGLRFGWPESLWREGVAPEVVEGLEEAAAGLERAGARRVPLEFLPGEYAVAAYYLLATAEASSNLARFDGVRYGAREEDEGGLAAWYARTRRAGFGPEVRRRVLLGTYALSAGYHDRYYVTAQRARRRIRREYEAALARCDLLLLPVAPTLPFRLGEKLDDPLAMYLSDIFTLGANLAGLPGLSVPVSPAGSGLPRAVQLLAGDDGEPLLLRAARALERRGGAGEDFRWPTRR